MMNSMLRNMMGGAAPMLPDPFEMLGGMASPFGMAGMAPMMPPMPPFPRHGHNSTSHHHTHTTAGMPGQVQSYSSYNSSDPFNGGRSFSSYSSSFVSMTNGFNGRPHVYEATSSSYVAPDGVRETKQSVRDSRTGRAEMAVGHHIRERSHVVKKSRNVETGQIDHEEDFVNVEEDQVHDFERDWRTGMSRGGIHALTGSSGRGMYQALGSSSPGHGRRYRDSSPGGVEITEVTDDYPQERLALPAPPPRPASHSGPSVSFNLPPSGHHERASSEVRNLPRKEKTRSSKKPYDRNP